ncbi:MATE family efflux transporter [Marinicella sp. W31]|uniref:MATE family efflux transporter n=1 Tax=Marinicella sp. W31 TaxID=3023713 RepID=UPI003757E1B3
MQTTTLKRHIVQTVRLSLPLILGQLMVVSMSVVDTMMSAGLGSVTLAAVGVGSSVWAMAILFVFGILMAIPPVVSEMDGANNQHKIAPFMRQVLWVALILGILFTVILNMLTFLFDLFNTQAEVIPHAVGYVKAVSWGVLPLSFFIAFRYLADGVSVTITTMYISAFGLALNIPLNYILMYGKFGLPELGAVGCGYATALVLFLQMIAYAIVVHRHKVMGPLKIFSQIDAPNWSEIKRFFILGFPVGMSMFAEVGFFAAVTLLSSSLTTDVAAAHQIALNFSSLLFMIPLGLSMGITIRVGNAVGRRNPIDIRRAGLSGIAVVMVTQFFSAALVLAVPALIVSFYYASPAVSAIATQLLLYAAIFQLSDGLQVAAAGALRGIKDMNYIMYSTLFSFWPVGFFCSWYLCFERNMGADGLWIGLIAGLSSAAVLNLLRFHFKTRYSSHQLQQA